MEELLQTPLPERPWQKVGVDLFVYNGNGCLICMDYYARFYELEQLHQTTSKAVIGARGSMFARFGVPNVWSDNWPQYGYLKSNALQVLEVLAHYIELLAPSK